MSTIDTLQPKMNEQSSEQELNSTIRVLILEDESTLRESCVSVLVQENYDVTKHRSKDAA